MSQLTLIAIFLLVIALWKFGPWFRKRRILSYDFPIGWWQHVAIIAPECANWEHRRRRRLEDYVRLFVDRVDFVVSKSMGEEFEIKHRVAFATQAFLLFEFQPGDPLAHVEKLYVQRHSNEPSDSMGLPRLFWEQRHLNYIVLYEISSLAGSLAPFELSQLPTFFTHEDACDPEAQVNIRRGLGHPLD